MSPAWRVILLLLLLAGTGWLAVQHIELDHRIDRFLPQPKSPQQALVSDQVSAGPGSRLIFAALGGAEPETLAAASNELSERWRAIAGVARVDNGAHFDPDSLEQLFRARFVLVDRIPARLAPEAVAASLDRRRADLALAGRRAESLVRRDPLGLLPELAETLAAGQPPEQFDEVWFDAAGERALILVRTTLSPFDIEAQQGLLDQLRASATDLDTDQPLRLELAGTPLIATDSARQTRADAIRLSTLAGGFLLLVLLLAWRSPLLVAAGSLPLLAGVVCGLLVTALAFDRVHGLTLAFGFTLLGVAMDYPLHLFAHTQGKRMHAAAHSIRKPLILGVLSTLVAYLAVWQSASPGLSQLGAFSAAGLAAAVAVTLLVLPRLGLRVPVNPRPLPRLAPHWPWLPGLLALAAIVLLWWPGQPRMSDQLDRLTPVSSELVAADIELRRAIGGDDLRWLLVVHNDDLEATLQAVEAATSVLESAAEQGLIDNWHAITQLIPSRATQEQRRAQWPDTETMAELLAAGEHGFRPDAFAPFLEDLAALDRMEPVDLAFWQATPLADRVEGLLTQADTGWRALILPSGIERPEALAAWLEDRQSPARLLVDLRATSQAMVADYRREVGLSLGIAVLLIVVGLALRLGGARPAVQVLLPVAAAVVCTAALIARLDQGLTIVHLIGLLLAGGIGLDFSLFSRGLSASRRQAGLTRRSLALCAVSSGGVFFILGLSEIGLLRMLGQTVAAGILLSLIFAWMSQPRARYN